MNRREMLSITFYLLSILVFISISSCYGSVKLSSSLLEENAVDGNRRKFVLDLSNENKKSGDPAVNLIGKRFRRYLNTENGRKVKTSPFHFYDNHYVAEVHWTGENSSSIMILMKDSSSYMTPSRPSHFYVSRDYGKNYENITSKFMLSNGTMAVISDFFSSKANHQKFILVAKFHKVLFISSDECKTFYQVHTYFYPSQIKYHPHFSYYVAAYEENMGSKRLYTSTNNGRRWNFKSSDVKAYAWSYHQPSDLSSYIYYHKDSDFSRSVIIKTRAWRSYYSRTMASGANDFQLVNQYMFVTKNGTIPGTQDLYISVNRKNFVQAVFPFTNNTKYDKKSMSFLVADATENETLIAVSHGNFTANLYISDQEGKRFSLSLESILYSNTVDGQRKYFQHDFVDLHKVNGVPGVYIATNLTKGKPGTRNLQSWITFDKGGTWSYIKAPPGLCKGKFNNCTLHLSQEFGFHNPSTRFSPIYSRKSAPGFILGTGSVGTSLKASPEVFLSTDAGLSWKKVIDGHYHYAFVDYGGIIVGVKKFGFINTLTYSWDEGHSWHDYQFSKTDLFRVYGLLTEPGEKTTIFTLFASKGGGHSWVIIQIDFKDFLGRVCQKNDYYLWELSDQRNDTEHCNLGRKQKFERRLPDVKCLNGYDYERIVNASSCLCSAEDYMCDFGFKEYVLGWFGKFCFPDLNYVNYTRSEPRWCRPGKLYNVSSGYRKVPGDACQGGNLEKVYLPETHACKIPEIKEFIFYAKSSYIVRYDTSRKQSTRIDLNGMKNVISLDYDYKHNTLFYADVTLDRIVLMNMTSGHLHEVIQFDDRRRYVEGIAYDWMNKDIYFTDVGSAEIGIVSLNGRFKKTLFGPDIVMKPRGIAVHPAKGLMFWTDLGKKAIYKANMNGENIKMLVQSNIESPNDLTIDYEKGHLYWADSGTDRLERVDLNGNYRKLILTRLNNPYSLDVLKDRIFWDDWSYGGIQSATKEYGNDKKSHVTWLYKPSALRAFWDGKQATTGNPCKNKRCPFKCLPAGGSADCVCPDGLTKNGTSGICLCPGNEVFDRTTGDCKPRSNETCNKYQFTCAKTRECIPIHWKCDGDIDCSDGTDEQDCNPAKKCQSNQLQCNDGACILSSWKCDGERDCADGSDEIDCKATTCAPNYVRCPSTVCISKNWLCDGEIDCDDGWDENNCARTTLAPTAITCPSGQFSCISSGRQKCFPNTYKCDAGKDCDDGSDEAHCHKVICRSDQFACVDGLECIPKGKHCNEWFDCTDHSDEKNCSQHTTIAPNQCGGDTKPCDNGRRCYDSYERCNGLWDCLDGTDERNCPKTTYTPITHIPITKRPCNFKCQSGTGCATRCNQITECPDGEDEAQCDNPSCRFPSPFVHKCGNLCLNITKLCDYVSDCLDSSDELDCEITGRVTNFKALASDSHSIKVTWRPPDKSLNYHDVIGYKVSYMNIRDVGNNRVKPIQLQTHDLHSTINNLEECNRYIVAVGLELKNTKTIFVEKTVEIGGWRIPSDSFHVVVNRDSIAWQEENGPCVQRIVDELTSRRMKCLKLPQMMDFDKATVFNLDVSLESPGSISEPFRLFKEGKNITMNSYQCRIFIGYKRDSFIVRSQKFLYPTAAQPNPAKHRSDGQKSKQNTLIWAIPVALVVLALFLGLAVMVYKYRRLQHSFLAFAARGNYTRQEDDLDEDDNNMVVGFHAGEDQPMINRFSDDEPLVVA